jgi:hypothetical protein
MNVYPHIVHNLLAQKGKMTIQEIHSSTLYRDKLNTLDKHAFMVGMVQYIIENLGNKRFVPSPNDWFFVFSQGDGDCGSVTIEELPLLNRCKMVKIRVPCPKPRNIFKTSFSLFVYPLNEFSQQLKASFFFIKMFCNHKRGTVKVLFFIRPESGPILPRNPDE